MKKNKKKSSFFVNVRKYFFDKFSEQKNDKFSIAEVVVIIFISILFGAIVGFVLSSSRPFGTEVSSEVAEIINTYDNIIENYYGEVSEDELLNAAVSGMVSTLDDPYSVFMDRIDTETFNETVDGTFIGIGITLEWNNGGFKIVDIISDSPAEKSGLKANDYIVEIDGDSIADLDLNDVSKLIKKKEKMSITVLRGDEKRIFKVKKGIIEIPSVVSKVLDNNIGYIFIESFASNTSVQFEEELSELEKKGIESLIIDVRDNPGGRLGQVNDILELFFSKKTILYQIGNDKEIKKVYSTKKDKKNYPVAILVNKGSASASEILAASFQENYKQATIVGTETFGKGTIQKAVELSSGASIKYTTQKWLTPKGIWIDGKGIIPDEVVELGDDINEDKQLEKAVEILKK